MVSRPLLKVLAAVGIFTVLASGCAEVFEDQASPSTPAASTSKTSGEPINIGVMIPLSGEGAVYGTPGQRVLQIALKEINDAGGINGRPVAFKTEDSGCDADPANKAINKLISVDKVGVVIGLFCSSELLTSAPVAEQNKVVLLSSGASSPKITAAGDFIFRNYPSDLAQGQALADYAAKKGYKNVGILVEEQPYTEGIADAFKEGFEKQGGTVNMEKFAKDASDFRTQITKLQSQKVDAFFVDPQAPAKGDVIIKQLQEAGVKGPFILSDVMMGAPKEFLQKNKEYLEGSIGAEVPYDKANPYLATFTAKYKELSKGEDMPYISYMAPTYDALFIIKEAIEKVGEDPVKIKDYLYTVKGRKGLAGTLSFDANGDPDKSYRHALRVVKGGAVEDYVEEVNEKEKPSEK